MGTLLSTRDLIDALARDGMCDPRIARRIIEATVAVLGERLTVDESASLSTAFAEPLRLVLQRASYQGDFGPDEMYARIRRRAAVDAALAREQAQVVLAAIGRAVPDDVARRLERALPRDVAELFRPRETGDPPPHAGPLGHTLASGRAGSRHPLAEAAATKAQSHSVVREANPHGETKLSSARGMTQERLGDSLAEGQPGSKRPISRTRDTERS